MIKLLKLKYKDRNSYHFVKSMILVEALLKMRHTEEELDELYNMAYIYFKGLRLDGRIRSNIGLERNEELVIFMMLRYSDKFNTSLRKNPPNFVPITQNRSDLEEVLSINNITDEEIFELNIGGYLGDFAKVVQMKKITFETA